MLSKPRTVMYSSASPKPAFLTGWRKYTPHPFAASTKKLVFFDESKLFMFLSFALVSRACSCSSAFSVSATFLSRLGNSL